MIPTFGAPFSTCPSANRMFDSIFNFPGAVFSPSALGAFFFSGLFGVDDGVIALSFLFSLEPTPLIRAVMLDMDEELESELESELTKGEGMVFRRKNCEIFPFRVGEDGADELVSEALVEDALAESIDRASEEGGRASLEGVGDRGQENESFRFKVS